MSRDEFDFEASVADALDEISGTLLDIHAVLARIAEALTPVPLESVVEDEIESNASHSTTGASTPMLESGVPQLGSGT